MDPQQTPPLAAKHTGTRISASGLLGRIARGVKLDGQRWACGELLKHLEEMAQHYYAGDVKAVDEFLQLYSLDKDRPVEKEKLSTIPVACNGRPATEEEILDAVYGGTGKQ